MSTHCELTLAYDYAIRDRESGVYLFVFDVGGGPRAVLQITDCETVSWVFTGDFDPPTERFKDMRNRLDSALLYMQGTWTAASLQADIGKIVAAIWWSGIAVTNYLRVQVCHEFRSIVREATHAVGEVFPEEGFAELVLSFTKSPVSDSKAQ